MNKIILGLFALSLSSQVLFAAEVDQAPVIKINGRTYQLEPIEKIKFRPLKNGLATGLLGAPEPEEFKGLPRIINTKASQTSIKNQGNRGSCTFFATSALVESLVKDTQGQDINMSEEYFTWITKAKKKYFARSEGSRAEFNAAALLQFGLMLEQDLHFQPTFFDKGMPCEKYQQDDSKTPTFCYSHNGPSKELLNKVISVGDSFEFGTIDSSSVEMVKNLSELRHPIVIGVPVHPNGWSTTDVKMTPEMMKECQSKPGLCGGHAVLVIGYDLDKRIFTFKNSWGTDWGNGGYGNISFDYIDQSDKRQYLVGDMIKTLNIPNPVILNRDLKISSLTSAIEGKKLALDIKINLKNVFSQAFQITAVLVTKDESQKDEPLMYLPVADREAQPLWVNSYTLTGAKVDQERIQKLSFSLENIDKKSLKGRSDIFARVTTYYVDDDGEKRVERQYVKVDLSL